METAKSLTPPESFAPHGQCFLWNSDLVLLHAISDAIAALAYFSIPIALLYFAKKRQDLPYKWMFVLFSAFIVTCGTTHLLGVWTIWTPDYWLQGAMKGVNAAVSVIAAGLLWPIMPRLLRLPSPAQLEIANQELQKKIAVLKLEEAELSKSRKNLDLQVRERTAELSQANKALHTDVAERIRTEKELYESREMLRQVVDNIPLYVFWKDRASNYLGCNTLFARSAGVQAPEAIIGKNDLDLTWKETANLYRTDDRTVIETNTPKLNFEEPMARPDGTTRWLRTSKVPLRDRDGRVFGMLGICEDITERKKVEAALQVREEQYRLLFAQSPLPMYVFEEDTLAFLAVNGAAIRHYGYTNDEFLAMTAAEIRPSEEVPHLQAYLRATRNQTVPKFTRAGAWRHRKKDGTVCDVEISDANISYLGKSARLVLVYDITARKRAEEALREAIDYNRGLIEASMDPITVVSPEGVIKDVNMAMEAATGFPREHLIGSDFSDYFADSEKAKVGCQQALAQGSLRDCQLTIRHSSGRLADVLYNATAYFSRAGEAQGILTTARDITERKRMQDQAARVERLAALGQLLGGIAHEIKNPLFVVTGRVQLLKEMLANREYDAVAKDLLIIEDAGKRMTEITHRFLNLARPLKPQWQKCWVHDILAQTLDFLANELMKNRVQVVQAFAPNIPPIWSEPRQLHEVFLNLILNALQAMTAAHGKGTLTITTGLENGSIVVRIQDDGPGISPQHRTKLFEPFFSTKPPNQGTGLGLWTVRSTMLALSGTVDCESAEGQGATFIVSMPVAQDQPRNGEVPLAR